jgi:hypothetical protein
MRKSESAWQEIFKEFDAQSAIERSGHFNVSAQMFKKLHYEPRLLTKFDHSRQLPAIMRDLGLSIFTLSNDLWRVGPYESFHPLPTWTPPGGDIKSRTLPTWIESIRTDEITGEGALINAADLSGIFEDFFGEPIFPTIAGKGRTGSFDFQVSRFDGSREDLQVRNAQIEVDAGFEGEEFLYLVEAKRHIAFDFNVRQLYYPFRTWERRVKKSVKTIYITWANGIFDLSEYEFLDKNDYSSITLVKNARYTLDKFDLELQDLIDHASKSYSPISGTQFSKVPFPQADDCERLVDLIDYLGNSPKSAQEIAANYDFHPRQADYYFSALKYLGLAEVVTGGGLSQRVLTPLGIKVNSLTASLTRLEVAKIMLNIPAIRETFLCSLAVSEPVSKSAAEKMVYLSADKEGISGATISRRAQTVVSWVKWMESLFHLS